MKTAKKIVTFGILPLLVVLLAVWAFLSTSGSDSYNYQGYIIAMRDTDNGTVITTLSEDKQLEFVVKRTTKKIFNGSLTELKEGAFIKLSTTDTDSANIKRFTAYEAYSMEGKIVLIEGQNIPFLLTINPKLNYNQLYGLISSQDIPYAPKTGAQVKVYYQYPLNAGTEKFVVDVIQPTTEILSPLTKEEIEYISRMGYTVASE